ncbi:probable UDP-sugar transporter protein SLC35A4 [Aplysia californica]|uniref:Probable UDP-sugar transporter protein SLC35A4 n=1 Tax=Aplysia californica TaxID=6500 RepID=A0ABM0JCE0_APLCA|nr:probable UDP-sugar transporter protein SLC35A4 [Aplysia californica]
MSIMRGMNKPYVVIWTVIILGEVLMYGGYGILVNLSKVNGRLPYLPSSFVLCTEILKMIICLVILWSEKRKEMSRSITLYSALPFAVPALCYCVNNNLAVVLQSHMDPATYMVLGNLKIVSTAVLYKFIMKKHIKTTKWFAVGLLATGGVLNSYTALQAKSLSLSEIHATWQGMLLLCCYCFISGFSGVYTEYILKQNFELSVYYQNALLYMFGVVFNSAVWIIQALRQTTVTKDTQELYIFNGYSVFTWALIITQAATGLIMSLIMKHLNNLVRLFIVSSSPLVTTMLAHVFFSLHVPFEFVLSGISVAAAIFLYSYN